MFNQTIYKCDLLSVTPDIRVNQDWPKKKNISEANKKIVKTILVQPTINPQFFKEIITEKRIPVYRITKKTGLFHSQDGDYYEYPPESPVFILVRENWFQPGNNLTVASNQEIQEYLSQNNKEIYINELNEVFEQATKYYNDAFDRNHYSDKAVVKSLLKKIK